MIRDYCCLRLDLVHVRVTGVDDLTYGDAILVSLTVSTRRFSRSSLFNQCGFPHPFSRSFFLFLLAANLNLHSPLASGNVTVDQTSQPQIRFLVVEIRSCVASSNCDFHFFGIFVGNTSTFQYGWPCAHLRTFIFYFKITVLESPISYSRFG